MENIDWLVALHIMFTGYLMGRLAIFYFKGRNNTVQLERELAERRKQILHRMDKMQAAWRVEINRAEKNLTVCKSLAHDLEYLGRDFIEKLHMKELDDTARDGEKLAVSNEPAPAMQIVEVQLVQPEAAPAPYSLENMPPQPSPILDILREQYDSDTSAKGN